MIVNITLHPFRAHCSGEIVHAVQSLMSLSFDMPTDEILDSKMRDGLEYRTVRTSFGKDVVPPYVKVFNADGHYVGSERWAEMLTKRGIVPELSSDDHKVCSVGFCDREQKWYGWSHRAMCGFGLGDRIFEQEYGNMDTLFTEHGAVQIVNLDQARQAAVNFADYVS
jgi:hypothetical protein